MLQPDPGATREYLDAIFASVPAPDPTQQRYLTGAVGHGGHYTSSGTYEFTKFEPYHFLWPAQRDQAVAHIEHWSPTADCYTCPYLQKTPERKRGNGAWRQLAHTDCDRGVDVAEVRKLGGFVVWSGSQGHGHVYVPLAYTLRQEQHEWLLEGLCDYLDGDRGKIRDNDLLRPSGSFSHKSGQPILLKAEKL